MKKHLRSLSKYPNLISFSALIALVGCAGMGKSTAPEMDADATAKVYQQFAPPALAASTSQLVKSLLETRPPGAGGVAPGQKKALFFDRSVNGIAQIFKLETPTSTPVQMTTGDEPTYFSEFTSDGKYAIVSRDLGTIAGSGLYLLPTAGGALIEIYKKAGVHASYGWSTNDAETIYYTANDIKPDSFAIYAYSVPTGQRELIFSEPGFWSIADAWGDRTFLLKRQKSDTSNEYWTWTRGEKGFVPVVGQNEDELYQVAFGNHPGEFFVLVNRLGKFRTLYYGKDAKLTPITIAESNEIESFDIDHMRFRLYIQRNLEGRGELEVLNPKTFDPVAFPRFDGADQVTIAQTSRLGRFISLSVESGAKPSVNYTFDWASQKLTTWKQTAEQVPTKQLVPQVLENYTAKDGAKIPMWVTRPAKCAKAACPVVVNFHDGPDSQSLAGFNPRAQIFASSGFVYVEPNIRGSSGYGKPYQDADNGAKRLNVIGDVEDCAKFIKSAWTIKGQVPKVGIMGTGYGGYLAQFAMGKYVGAYDAGVSVSGMSELDGFLKNQPSYHHRSMEIEFGDVVKDAALLKELSPITYAAQVAAPLLLIQGARGSISTAIKMHEAVVKHVADSPLMLIGGRGVSSRSLDNQVEVVGQALSFFQKNLN